MRWTDARRLCEAIGQKIGYSSTRTLNRAATQDGETSLLAKQLNLPLREQVGNSFQKDWKIWDRKIVDFVFGDPESPLYYFELESLDRAQLYLFLPHGGHETTANSGIIGERFVRKFVAMRRCRDILYFF